MYSPFDTGDRCFIDGMIFSALTLFYKYLILNLTSPHTDENLVVKKMGLFAVSLFSYLLIRIATRCLLYSWMSHCLDGVHTF